MPKKLPTPFRRESIGVATVKREWVKDLPAEKLVVGDTVAGKGRVTRVVHFVDGVAVNYVAGEIGEYGKDAKVFAFTAST